LFHASITEFPHDTAFVKQDLFVFLVLQRPAMHASRLQNLQIFGFLVVDVSRIHPATTKAAQVFCISQHSKSLSSSRLLTALTGKKTTATKQLQTAGAGEGKGLEDVNFFVKFFFGGEVSWVWGEILLGRSSLRISEIAAKATKQTVFF